MRNKKITPEAVALYLPQFFVGFFFLAAAYIKATEGLFGAFHAPSLAWIVEGWKTTTKFMPHFYFAFADNVIIPYANYFAIAVIVLQAVIGLFLITNRYLKVAGILLVFVQLNIYLAVYNQLELRVLNSQAMLLGIFYFARPVMRGSLWKLMTYALVLVGLIHLYGRASMFSDHSPEAYFWQRQHFSAYVMSSWPGLKYFYLWFTSGTTGPLLWASAWWIKVLLMFGMLTQYRLQAGIAWLVFVTMITMIWLSSFSCEGAFWVITMFVWVMHEHDLQKNSASPPVSYLP